MSQFGLKPFNQALVDFVQQHQPISTFDAFSKFEGAGNSQTVFSHRLTYLSSAGWLSNSGTTGRGMWCATGKKRDQTRDRIRPTEPKRIDLVPPRRINVMNGPVYRPGPANYRAGSQDFTNCPSVTLGQIISVKHREIDA